MLSFLIISPCTVVTDVINKLLDIFPYTLHIMLNQLTVMCTTHGERRLISIWCQKECLESKLDRQTDARGDYSAYLWVVQNFDAWSLKYCVY